MNTTIQRKLLLLPIVFLCVTVAAHAQTDAFLKVPNITGQSETNGYEDQIGIEGYSFYAFAQFTRDPIRFDSADVPSIEFYGLLDTKAFPKLLEAALTGELYDKTPIIFTQVRNIGGKLEEFFKMEIKGHFTTVSQSGNSGDQPYVQLSFLPTEVKITTTSYKPDGSKDGTAETVWKRPEK